MPPTSFFASGRARTQDTVLPPRELPQRPDAAARRGCSLGRRNTSAGNGRGNGGTEPPWHYERRISTLGPRDGRSKQFRGQYEAAVRHQLLAGVLYDVDVTVAHLFIDWTFGGTRDWRITEAAVAAALPARSNGEARSKRIASDALDRLRDAGLIDWQHGTKEEFYDEQRRALLNGRWQGPSTYRLIIPAPLHQVILAREGEARSETFRKQREQRQGGRTGRLDTVHATRDISPREARRRRVQSLAASIALLETTTTFDVGVAILRSELSDADEDLMPDALAQFEESWTLYRGRARGPT